MGYNTAMYTIVLLVVLVVGFLIAVTLFPGVIPFHFSF